MRSKNKFIKYSIVLLILCEVTVKCMTKKFSRVSRVPSHEKSQNFRKTVWSQEEQSNFQPIPFSEDNKTKSIVKEEAEGPDVVLKKIYSLVKSTEKRVKNMKSHDGSSNDKYLDTDIKTVLANISEIINKNFVSVISRIQYKEFQEREILRELITLSEEITRVKDSIKDGITTSKKAVTAYDLNCESKLNNIEYVLKMLMETIKEKSNLFDELPQSSYAGNLRINRQVHVKNEKLTRDHLSEIVYEFRRALREKHHKPCDCGARSYDALPADCSEIINLGFNISGIYKVRPEDADPFYVLCDMESTGGGWTVIQNRYDGSQDFNKPWSDYKHGFGNLAGEFWLGLEKIYLLSNQKLYELRVEMHSMTGQDVFAAFTVFSVGSEIESYRISALGSYYGNSGDSLTYHSGQKFSTFDVDNDDWKDGSCSEEHGGAWWYKECDKSNLNGKYNVKSDDASRWQGVYWNTFKGPTNYLKRTKMMLRPLPISRTESVEIRLRKNPPKITEPVPYPKHNLKKVPKGGLQFKPAAEDQTDVPRRWSAFDDSESN